VPRYKCLDNGGNYVDIHQHRYISMYIK
jgi:hypothetical protein